MFWLANCNVANIENAVPPDKVGTAFFILSDWFLQHHFGTNNFSIFMTR
jgi:hypothetical protein